MSLVRAVFKVSFILGGAVCNTPSRASKRTEVTTPRREQQRKDLFPGSDPDGYRAEPGPYSCRSRHDLHHACRTVRELRSLSRLSPRTQPPPLPTASLPTPYPLPSPHYSMEKVSRLRRLNRTRCRLRRRTATETDHDATASCRSTALAGCARSAIAAPIPLPPHFACFLLEARKHAKCYVVGDVHRSTPCRVRMARAVASSVTSHAEDAHDVPLRGG